MNIWDFLHLNYISKVGLNLSMVASFLLGGWSMAMTVLLVMQALDIISGLMLAFKEKNLSSMAMREGLLKKVGIWIVLIVAHFIDLVLFGGGLMATTAVSLASIANEGMSITENLANVGVPIPAVITQYLKQIKNKSEEKTQEEQKKLDD